MKYFLLIVQMWYAASVKVESPNCLRNNPELLDADFSLWNRFERRHDFSAEDVSKHVTLFSTRFKRGHSYIATNTDDNRLISEGLSIFTKTTNRSFQLFIRSAPKRAQNVSSAIKFYKNQYKLIKKINSRNIGILAGMYLNPDTKTYDGDLEVIDSVFGSKNKSTFHVGKAYKDCILEFKEPTALQYLQRLDFVSCRIIPTKTASPESSANYVIGRCRRLHDMASFYNITAEIRCIVSYPSYGTTTSGIVGSVSGFQKFWCKIIDEIKLKNSMPQIIMDSAFDNASFDYKNNTVDLHDAMYHEGWWKRRETTSYEASAFLEKVEELEGGTEPGNCTPLCSPCNSSGECCQGTLCQTDSSFQPFENTTTQQTCQSALTECAPRLPKSPEWTSPDGQSFLLLSVSIIIIVALIFIVGVVTWLLYSRKRTNSVLTKTELSNFFDGSPFLPDGESAGQLEFKENADYLAYDQTLEVTNKTFEIYEHNILGSGAFGVVVKGLLNNEDVAVKTTLPGADIVYVKSLLMELKILMYLGQHENIVNLRGAHTTHLTAGKVYLFLELCPFGSLLEFLRSHRETFSSDSQGIQEEIDKTRLNCKDLLQWSVQIAGAMEHLAVHKVVHADIAARNVLVFSKDQVKLTDFGLSRRLYEYKNYVRKSQEPLPWRHMSVEALADMYFSVKGDVWSFGVTLWEMFSLGKVPYPGHSLSQDFVELLQDGLHPPCPQHAHPIIYEVMNLCWTVDFELRPQISIVRCKLVNAFDELYTAGLYHRPIDKTEESES